MKRITTSAIAFSAAFLGTLALLGAPQDAEAYSRRVHAGACHHPFDDNGSSNTSYMRVGNDELSGFLGNVYCHVPSDSFLPHAAVTQLNFHGRSPTLRMTVRACTQKFNDDDADCGTGKVVSSEFGGATGISLSRWHADPAGMPYITVKAETTDHLYGFWMTN
jgi:hypothetical protein